MFRDPILRLLALLVATGAGAAELQPQAGTSIALGDVRGVAYYTVESTGHRVVTTVSAGPASTPVRLVATLTAGQSISLSVPGAIGTPALVLQVRRVGERILVEGDQGEADGPEHTASAEDARPGRPSGRW
jgi:hypothetical protein